MVEFNRIMGTIKPAEISALAEKEFLVDMGKNLTGWVEIPVGMEAEIPLPAEAEEYRLNGRKIALQGGKLPLIRIKSGKYNISYNRSVVK